MSSTSSIFVPPEVSSRPIYLCKFCPCQGDDVSTTRPDRDLPRTELTHTNTKTQGVERPSRGHWTRPVISLSLPAPWFGHRVRQGWDRPNPSGRKIPEDPLAGVRVFLRRGSSGHFVDLGVSGRPSSRGLCNRETLLRKREGRTYSGDSFVTYAPVWTVVTGLRSRTPTRQYEVPVSSVGSLLSLWAVTLEVCRLDPDVPTGVPLHLQTGLSSLLFVS